MRLHDNRLFGFIRGSLVRSLIVMTGVLVLTPIASAAHTKTRASQLGEVALGVGNLMHMEDFLRAYPGSRTSILSYMKLDSFDVDAAVQYMRWNASTQAQMGREFWPQVALETSGLGLAEFRRQLAQPGSKVDRSIRLLAREIAKYRRDRKWFFIRPFSEMNDGTLSNPWEFALKDRHNTPNDLAAIWMLLHRAFDEEGADNAVFVFSPLAAYSVHHEAEVLETLNLIPLGMIDVYGLNVYSRPMTAYRGASPDPIPFAQLAQPWLNVLAQSKHRGLPLAVSEMAVSNQATDDRRATWVREAFNYARKHEFVMVTYFNYPHPYWHIDDNTLAGQVLRAEINHH